MGPALVLDCREEKLGSTMVALYTTMVMSMLEARASDLWPGEVYRKKRFLYL